MSDSEKLASIQAIVMDVDGVLTDGSFIWCTDGGESKKFSFEDVMGLSRAQRAGLRLGLISGEDSPLIDRFAAKIGIGAVVKGCKDKGAALRDFSDREGVPLEEVAFVGDDVNDIGALEIAGLSVAPSNAQPEVKAIVDLVLQKSGGCGAVRQLVESLLAARKHKS